MTKLVNGWPDFIIDRSLVTIGNFDGMHRGHQTLIELLKEKAKISRAKTIVVTFWPHPRVFLQSIKKPYYITTLKERLSLLRGCGLDYIITLPFDTSLANKAPTEFLNDLVSRVRVESLVIGESFTLGKDRSGTIPLIMHFCSDRKINLEILKSFCFEGIPVSSGRVRKALEKGDVETCRILLGRPYSVEGKVVEGKHLGSKLGFPTANILVDPIKLLPRYGVYASQVLLGKHLYQGVTNIGVRPTFEQSTVPNVETLLLDFDGDIYNKKISIHLLHHLRDEIRFSDTKALIAQIELDKSNARRLLDNEYR